MRTLMHMEMTCNLRLVSSRVVVFGTEDITNRQNGTSLHKQESVAEGLKSLVGDTKRRVWSCYSARVNVTENDLEAPHLPDRIR
jgi:hypothetical protein